MGQLAFGDGEGGDMQASQPKIKVNVDASGDVIATPHDPDARFSRKRDTQWLGHKTQVTETVDGDFPIINDIGIRSAIESDGDALAAIYERLKERGQLPEEPLVDQGYCHGETLRDSEKKGGGLARSGRRLEQESPEFKEEMKQRIPIESTIGELTRRHGLRRSRYRGRDKARLQAAFTAAAVNLKRLARHLGGAPAFFRCGLWRRAVYEAVFQLSPPARPSCVCL